MQYISTKSTSVSMVPPIAARDEVEGFSYNALAVLGPNYLIKRWLPKKGPAFVAMILAMRAHIFYNFDTREQQTRYFPEAATIAKMAGISRAKVFRLLNDPDMLRFIRREKQRRWDKVMHKEVTTSNRYYVALDDPPTPEDEHLVREAQERLATITSYESAIVDDDRPARRKGAKSSESQFETLIAVSERDSDSSIKLRREDRISKQDFLGGDTSISPKGIGAAAIGNESAAQQVTKERRKTRADETNGDAQQSDRLASSDSAAPRRPVAEPAIVAAAILTESEVWRVDARVVAAGAICRHVEHFQGTDPESALEKILSAHAHYLTPPAVLEKLAEIARNRTDNRYAHIDETATGYYISVLANLAAEARKCGYDLPKLAKKASKAQRKDLIALPTQRAYTPRQQVRSAGYTSGATSIGEDYYERLNAARYGR